jgi:hypothetical protein
MRAVDGAAEVANIALDDLSQQLSSWGVNKELNELARHLFNYSRVNGVDHFLARYNKMSH